MIYCIDCFWVFWEGFVFLFYHGDVAVWAECFVVFASVVPLVAVLAFYDFSSVFLLFAFVAEEPSAAWCSTDCAVHRTNYYF